MKKLSFVLILLFFPAAWASGPDTLQLSYDGYLGGFYTADLSLTADWDKKLYTSTFDLRTQGLMRALTKFRARVRSVMVPDGADGLVSKAYEQETKTGKKTKSIGWVYDPARDRAVSQSDPEAVREDMRRDVTDPLTAFILIRLKLRDMLKTGQTTFVLPLYTGKHRFDLTATLLPSDTTVLYGEKIPVYHVGLTADPLDGIKEKNRKDWENSRIDLFFSKDETLLPLQVVVKAEKIAGVLNLQKHCFKNPVCRRTTP